jgi:hypothetical protein
VLVWLVKFEFSPVQLARTAAVDPNPAADEQ